MRRAVLTLAFVLALTSTGAADGVLIPHPRPWLPPNPAVDVKYHHVEVEIDDPVALTKIDQVFVNPYGREIEADYIFPIPEGAAVSRFVAWLGGHRMEAELLDADQARKVYEDIVRRRKDPALLEYVGRGMYRLRVYPIPPGGEVRIKIEYEQTLSSDYGTVEYLYPLNTEKYSRSNLEDCRVEVDITSFQDIGAVYCPTHPVKTERQGDRSFKAVYEEEDVKPNKDFVLYFTRQERHYGFHLLSYREPGEEDGFFLGLLSPPPASHRERVNKNVIFVLDSSGSMRGEKIAQAIEALKFCLRGLNEGDYFNIIDYDDDVRQYRDKLVEFDGDNLGEGEVFADRLEASGGTNIYEALATACHMIPTNDFPTYVLFLTDGLPTVGNTDLDQIVDNTTTLNEGRARLFVFGVGYDVNAHLLDRLSQDNNGVAQYVMPDEDIEVKVSRLASKITYPAMTDLRLAFNPKEAYQVYPDPLPDLFYGSEIIVAGRYRGEGNSTALISGEVSGTEVRYEFPVSFSDGSAKDEFIPLLWANRRIGYLLQQMRLHGRSDELLEEVIGLSKRYGIITEYTSFLVTGDEQMRAEEIRALPPQAAGIRLESMMDKKAQQQTGKSAVTQSLGLYSQQFSTQTGRAGEVMIDGEKRKFDNVTQVGSQAFFKSGDNWIQGDLHGDEFDIEIKRFSEAYFQLISMDTSLGRYFALGEKVRLRIGTLVVQISDTGKETLTTRELRSLFPS